MRPTAKVAVGGDVPMITSASLQAALDLHREGGSDVTVLSANVDDPTGLGRIVRDDAGAFLRIVEEKDATAAERTIHEINAGHYIVRAEVLHDLLGRITNENAQSEYYLTDIVGLAAGAVQAVPLEDEAEGPRSEHAGAALRGSGASAPTHHAGPRQGRCDDQLS